VTGVVNTGADVEEAREWLQWSRILIAAAFPKREAGRITSAT
jgi:hypothetical protein